jgi:hypothetical protein
VPVGLVLTAARARCVTDDGLAPVARPRAVELGAARRPAPRGVGPGAGRVQPPAAPPPFDAGTGPVRAAPTTAPTLAATTIREHVNSSVPAGCRPVARARQVTDAGLVPVESDKTREGGRADPSGFLPRDRGEPAAPPTPRPVSAGSHGLLADARPVRVWSRRCLPGGAGGDVFHPHGHGKCKCRPPGSSRADALGYGVRAPRLRERRSGPRHLLLKRGHDAGRACLPVAPPPCEPPRPAAPTPTITPATMASTWNSPVAAAPGCRWVWYRPRHSPAGNGAGDGEA